jgi:APA family basic amino acid/polyamine antiporter
MGNMIGSGVFLLPASLAPYGWSAVGGWAATIAGAMALAYVLARLTRALPAAGGPVEMVAAAFGPVPAFMIGWSYWVSVWTANVTIAVAAASYLSLFVPALAHPGGGAIGALALIWLMTALNLRGAGAAGRFQLATLIVKLVPLVVVLALIGWMLARPDGPRLPPVTPQSLNLAGVTASATLTLWALLGFECASLAAAKVRDPARNIVRATLIGTGATGLLYLTVCSGIALLLPPAIAAKSSAPFADFVAMTLGSGAAQVIGLFAAVSAIGALGGWVLIQGEVPLAMARAGQLPAWLGATDQRGTPRRALILSSALASLLLAANSLKGLGDLFTFMALLSTAATLWLYLGYALAAMRLRVAVTVAVPASLYALWTLYGAGPHVSALSLLLMLAGLPLYGWVRRGAARRRG